VTKHLPEKESFVKEEMVFQSMSILSGNDIFQMIDFDVFADIFLEVISSANGDPIREFFETCDVIPLYLLY